MPYIRFSDGTEIGVSVEDIIYALKNLFKRNTPHLIYDVDKIIGFYTNTLGWLTYTEPSGEVIKAPYTLEVDFRATNPEKHWGVVHCEIPYEFPNELLAYRTQMVSDFTAKGKLHKGNRACPRVKSFDLTSRGKLHLCVQRAMYFDQVGTNLTLDFPFNEKTLKSRFENVRGWDLANGISPMVIPSFEQSKMANTIGIAVGITALDKFGKKQILKRMRTDNTAVYENQWHVPFSFALEWPDGFEPGERMTLSNMINRDYGHELAEEMPGIERSDFESPKLLAFCRDMIRGGKPQFFFEIRSRQPIETLQRQIRSDKVEYKNKTGIVEDLLPTLSPELIAFSLLVKD